MRFSHTLEIAVQASTLHVLKSKSLYNFVNPGSGSSLKGQLHPVLSAQDSLSFAQKGKLQLLKLSYGRRMRKTTLHKVLPDTASYIFSLH